MSAQRFQTRPDTESQPNRTAQTRTRTRTRARTTPTERSAARAAVENSPQTFSRGNTEQLQNLIDEFNAAFAADADDSASGS